MSIESSRFFKAFIDSFVICFLLLPLVARVILAHDQTGEDEEERGGDGRELKRQFGCCPRDGRRLGAGGDCEISMVPRRLPETRSMSTGEWLHFWTGD
jgi:hypothetical protein